MGKYVGKRKGGGKKNKKQKKNPNKDLFCFMGRHSLCSRFNFPCCFRFLQLMPDSTSNPLRISRIAWRRKKPAISLLAVWHLALLLLLLLLRLLLLAFKSSPMIRLPLIAVIYQESQGACEGDDDEIFNNSLVDIIEAV